MNNWTKNQPCFSGDIMGDWREELVLRAGDNTELRIYPTTIPLSIVFLRCGTTTSTVRA